MISSRSYAVGQCARIRKSLQLPEPFETEQQNEVLSGATVELENTRPVCSNK